MQSIKTKDITKNYVPTDFVSLDDKFFLFFPHTPFTHQLKDLLNNTNISFMFTEGKYINAADIVNFNENAHEDSTLILLELADVQSVYNSLLIEFKKIFISVGTSQHFVFEEINYLVYQEILPVIKKNAYAFLLIIPTMNCETITQDYDYYVNIALKNLLFALACLEIFPSKIMPSINRKAQAGICSLLMNIGMLSINTHLIENNQSINIQYRNPKVIPIIIKMNNSIFKKSFLTQSYLMIIQHINNCFLTPKKPPQIEESIRDIVEFVTISSSYIFLISHSHGHTAFPPSQALYTLLQTPRNVKIFSTDLLEDFLHLLGNTPPGSVVELENGSIAIVYKPPKNDEGIVNINAPLVVILTRPTGETLNTPIVVASDLNKGFNIKHVLSYEKAITYLNIKYKVLSQIIKS